MSAVLDRIREQAAKELGVQPDRVALIRLDLDFLLKKGALIDIDVGGVTLFTRRSTWDELGVPENSIRRVRFTRGVKHLIPYEYVSRLHCLAEKARQSLDRHSFVVKGFWPYRWVPYTAYQSWREEFEGIRREFEAVKAEILEKYDDFVDALEGDFEAVAREVHPILQNGKSLEEFTKELVEEVLARMPSRYEIEVGLYMDYSTAVLVDPATWERHLAELERARKEAELAAQKLALEEAKLQAEQEKVELARKVEQEKALQELRKLEEMRRAELEHYKEQLRRMASPIEEVFHQLRAQMYGHARAILENMRKNHGRLTGPAARRARSMVETFRLLNALDDRELERLLNDIERELDKAASKRNVGNLEETLKQIAKLTAESAAAVEKALRPSRISAVRLGM